MKIKILMAAGFFVCTFFSSCLKDTAYLDASNTAPIIQFGLSPASGNYGPFSYEGDTAASPKIDTAIALVIASPQVLTKDITITIALDTTQIGAFNSANGTNFTALPSSLYTLGKTSVTIPAGYRVGRIPVTLNFPQFPASHNYALPLVITNGDGLIISGNSSTFMWLFQR